MTERLPRLMAQYHHPGNDRPDPPIELWRSTPREDMLHQSDLKSLTEGMDNRWRVYSVDPLRDNFAHGRQMPFFQGSNVVEEHDELDVTDMREARESEEPSPNLSMFRGAYGGAQP